MTVRRSDQLRSAGTAMKPTPAVMRLRVSRGSARHCRAESAPGKSSKSSSKSSPTSPAGNLGGARGSSPLPRAAQRTPRLPVALKRALRGATRATQRAAGAGARAEAEAAGANFNKAAPDDCRANIFHGQGAPARAARTTRAPAAAALESAAPTHATARSSGRRFGSAQQCTAWPGTAAGARREWRFASLEACRYVFEARELHAQWLPLADRQLWVHEVQKQDDARLVGVVERLCEQHRPRSSHRFPITAQESRQCCTHLVLERVVEAQALSVDPGARLVAAAESAAPGGHHQRQMAGEPQVARCAVRAQMRLWCEHGEDGFADAVLHAADKSRDAQQQRRRPRAAVGVVHHA